MPGLTARGSQKSRCASNHRYLVSVGKIADLFHSDRSWDSAVENLRGLESEYGEEAQARALNYAAVYSGARGAMIVDVVASRQRRYQSRVIQIVSDWKNANAEHTIAWLADHRLEREDYGLSDNEVDTIQEVAKRLCSFAAQQGLTAPDQEDQVCRLWADRYGAFEHAPMLDPVVGSVKGIGLALFAYARMRSGADAIKPDVRVKKGLRSLGFSVPDDEHAVLLVATAAAEDIGMSRLVLDQLLWWLGND